MKVFSNHQTTRTPRFCKTFLGVLVSWWFISSSAFATPFVYAPPTCDFTITFPEKPFIEKKCVSGEGRPCDEVLTYTQMSESSSLNFRVTCLKDDPKILSAYKPEELKATLNQMVKDAGLRSFATDAASLKDGIRTSVALATGKRDGRDVIYTGQIWIGPQSLFTMEGDMTGPQNKKIDDIYSGILKSIKPKNDAKTEPAASASAPLPQSKKPVKKP